MKEDKEDDIKYNSESFDAFLEFWKGMESSESTRDIIFSRFHTYLNHIPSCQFSRKSFETSFQLAKVIHDNKPYDQLCEYCFMKFQHYIKDTLANDDYHTIMDAFHVVYTAGDKENENKHKRRFKYRIAKYISTKINNEQI